MNPSFWRPSISDISGIQSADLALLNGAGFATWVDRASLPRSKGMNTSTDIEEQFVATESLTGGFTFLFDAGMNSDAKDRFDSEHPTYGPPHVMKSTQLSVLTKRLVILTGFIAALWVIQAINWITGYSLNPSFGLIPRQVYGLDGVIAMPVLHGSFAHLMSNTPPLMLMGTLLAATATRALVTVNAIIIGLGGALVWLLGSSAIHIGASGLVFGWFGFLLARGVVDRSFTTLAAALVVGVLYGSIILGVLPGQPGVSWEAHLFGALAGVAAAILIRTHVHAPRTRDVDRL